MSSLTLEPIAAMNAAIPAELRLLNLALVDIGAGTTDIAVCRDGSVTGYTMATIAGDEVTEAIMRAYLVDFQTAETLKRQLGQEEAMQYTDILGEVNSIRREELQRAIDEPMTRLAEAIGKQVSELNGGAPSAVFLAGGGSKLEGLREKVAQSLQMDARRVAIAGSNYEKTAYSEDFDLNNPEYATPLGIAVSAALGLLNDSYVVTLNNQAAKLFRSGILTLRDILLMNGYTYADMLGKSGRNLSLTLNGRHMLLRGEPAAPAVLKINDEDAGISTVVHAGDRIQFTPARPGKDAAKTLRELLGADYTGRVLVNNQEAGLDTALQQGDVILTLEGVGRGPRPEPVQEERAVPVQEVRPRPEPVQERRPAPEPRLRIKKRTLEIVLNGKPLILPPKENDQPYYVMDLLERSGVDFETLDRPVQLAVNGMECSFSQELRERDSVTIR